MSLAFIFPGQGSQFIGMGSDLYRNFNEAREVFEEIDDVLSQKLSKLMFEGNIDELTLTSNTQPALMAVSLAIIRIMEKGGFKLEKISYIAGHSLGEYTALCAAKSYNLRDTAKLLRIRGDAMQNAVKKGEGAMFALLGATLLEAEEIAKEAAGNEICEIANDNAPGQIVLSGHMAAIERAIKIATNKGKRSIKLNVSAPFHSSLMKPAAKEMEEAFKNFSISKPVVPIISNITANIIENIEEMPGLLVRQVAEKVRWHESVLKMKELGVSEIIEIGPGKVLTNMIKRIDGEIKGSNIQDSNDIKRFFSQL